MAPLPRKWQSALNQLLGFSLFLWTMLTQACQKMAIWPFSRAQHTIGRFSCQILCQCKSYNSLSIPTWRIRQLVKWSHCRRITCWSLRHMPQWYGPAFFLQFHPLALILLAPHLMCLYLPSSICYNAQALWVRDQYWRGPVWMKSDANWTEYMLLMVKYLFLSIWHGSSHIIFPMCFEFYDLQFEAC